MQLYALKKFLMASGKQAALGFIFITILVDVIGFGLIIPVLPEYIMQLTGCNNSQASAKGGLLLTTYAIVQFFFAPVLGNLSDRYGRRPVLLISLFGFGLDYLLQGLAPTLGWLFVGRIIAGIAGSSFTTASAYIADISTAETRTKNFGIIGAAFGVGFVVGPMIGGLLGGIDVRLPFYAAAGLCLLNWLYGYFVLPESLPPERRRPFEWKRANPFGSLRFLKQHPSLGALAISLLLIYIAVHAVQSNWTYYTKEKFEWTEITIGISLTAVGILVGAVQAGLTRVVNPRLGNEKSIYTGFLFYAAGMLLFAFASHTWMMFAFLVPYCMGGISGPALQSTIAGQIPPNQQGELQGALTGLMSLSTIIGPSLMTGLFSYFTGRGTPVYFPGAPFILGSILIIISSLLSYQAFRKHKPQAA